MASASAPPPVSAGTRMKPRQRQKHVTTACVTCRTRKIKCDAAVPRCSNCALYAQECIYHPGMDKRRIPMKERLLAVESYARQLEGLLASNGIPIPPNMALDSSTSSITLGESAAIVIPPSQSRRSTKPATPPALLGSYPDGPSPSSEDTSPLVSQLAGNLGLLQVSEDGQLRFYGATSNLHLLVTGATREPKPFSFPTAEDVQTTLEAAGVGNFVEQEFEEHLIKLYFCWEDPSIHLVDKDVFYRERQRCKACGQGNRLYSEVLVNAMCAIGASLTPRHCVELPESLVEFFSSRARALLDVELDSPTLSTVQSLGILSAIESICTRDARGWLYSGMAVRLALDLGMHLDTQAYVEAGILDAEEATLRRAVFWGAFIHERMWSLYLGRPVSLEEKTISAPPYVGTTVGTHCWRPYIDEHDDSDFPTLPDPIEELHRSNATLCSKMSRIRETLYDDAKVLSLAAPNLHEFATGMRAELLQWHASLPESLHVDLSSVSTAYVAHVLQLHMQYHTVMILVNRPFFSANPAAIASLPFPDPLVGRPACTDSAKAISKLLKIYRRLYSFRRINVQAVHLIFTASLIHVLNACEATDASLKNSAWQDLEVCCQALTEMAKGYGNANRALQVIDSIKTELLKSNREKAKRDSDTSSTSGYGLAKRRRSSHWTDDIPSQAPDNVLADMILNPANNIVDSMFWSELTTFDFTAC